MKKILYLGWLGKANVGDELLLDIFKKMINKEAEINNLTVNVDVVVANLSYQTNINEYDLVVVGGGSLLKLKFWEDYCKFVKDSGVPYIIWGTGIDSRDDNYVKRVIDNYENKQNGLFVPESTVDAINNSELTSLRGNLTKFLLNNDEKIEVIGDPCIIYNKLDNKFPSESEINEILNWHNDYVFINWGHSYNNVIGNNEKELFAKISKVIQILVNRGEKVVIYPIWDEDIEICKKLANQFNEENVILLEKVYDAYYLMKFAEKAKYSVNFKLHANIISVAMKTPFISLSYGIKGYDFADSVDLAELSLFTSEVEVRSLLDKISYIENNYNEIKSVIQRNIDKYYDISTGFMKKIINLLLENNEKVETSYETKPVFVLGSGRSGTHLLGYVLDSNQDTVTTIEKPLIFNRVVNYATSKDRSAKLYNEIKDIYEMEILSSTKKYYVDKSHPNIWLADKLSNDFNDAKFIGILRSPFSTVSSMLKHHGVLNWCKVWDTLSVPNEFLGITNENLNDYRSYSLPKRCALRWKSHREKMLDLKDVLKEKLLIINYEELLTNPNEVKFQIKEFLELESDFEFDNFNRNSLNKWRENLTNKDIEDIQSIIGNEFDCFLK